VCVCVCVNYIIIMSPNDSFCTVCLSWNSLKTFISHNFIFASSVSQI